jgi:hypothetical protein
MDLSVVTVLPSLSAVGSWEEVLLFSMDFMDLKMHLTQVFSECVLLTGNMTLPQNKYIPASYHSNS